MKTNKDKLKELQEKVVFLQNVITSQSEVNRKLGLLASRYTEDEIIDKLKRVQDLESTIEVMYNFVTSTLLDEFKYSILESIVLEERAKIKLQKEIEV